MSRFKKSCLALASIGILLFSACSTPKQVQSGSETPSVSTPESEESSGEIVLCTDPYGGLFKQGYGVKAGYYDQFNSTGKAVNILYTDYQTRQRIYLCNRPECKHNDESCASFLSTYGDIKLFANKAEDTLFLVSSGYADTPNPTENQMGKIYSMSPTGADRKVLYQLSGAESFTDAIAMDDEYLYVTVLCLDTDDNTMKKELRKIDIKGGESLLIYTFESTNDRVFGAFGGTLVLQRYTDAERFYECLNVNTGVKTQTYRHAANEIRLEMVHGTNLYSIRRSTETPNAPSPIYAVDLVTGEEKIINEVQIYNTDATFITGVFDGKLEINATDNRDVDKIKFNVYYLDLASNEIHLNTLTFPFFQDTRNVTIVAQTKEQFLVETGITQGSVTMYDNAGLPYTANTAIPIHSLIAKEDFWNGTPNYIPVQNNVGVASQ